MISIVLIHSWINAQNKNNLLIKFDGLYETECNYSNEENSFEGERYYLRFYADGKVISVTTVCDETSVDIKNWFNNDMGDVSIGKYNIKNNKIIFSSIDSSGEVKYKGKIEKSGLINLKWKSLINGNKGAVIQVYSLKI